jgi:hypothetical protein
MLSSSLHLPVFLTWQISVCPLICTWAIKRLGRAKNRPATIWPYFISVHLVAFFVIITDDPGKKQPKKGLPQQSFFGM